MNGLRERLYPSGFRPMRQGPPLFVEANLNPHFWPFKGVVLSIVVHATLLSGLITIPLIIPDEDERPRLDEAIILDADDLKDVLYLPLLGRAPAPKPAANSDNSKPAPPLSAKEGLSYPGPQPILSKFPVPTNHNQTILQPNLQNPMPLDPSLLLPNVVRLPAPVAEPRLKVPEAVAAKVMSPTMAAQPDVALKAPERPLAAPVADSRMKVPEQVTTTKPLLASPFPPLDAPLAAPAKPLAAPLAESKLKVPDQVTQVARPANPASVAQFDGPLTGPAKPLAAPLAESRFKLPDPVVPIARPAVPVAMGDTNLGLSGPSRPLAAPLAESRLKVPDAATFQVKPSTATAAEKLDVPLTAPAKPLAAPLAESKLKVPDPSTTQARPSTAGAGTASAAATKLDGSLTGPAKPLAAPLAESRMRVPDASAPVPSRSATASTAPRIDAPMTGPARPLAAPLAESKVKVPDSATTAPRLAPAIAPLDSPVPNTQPLVALSPTPARRDQPVVVPPGEARGNFAISPQPNLTFPGTEPGARASNAASSASATNSASANNSNAAGNRNNGTGTSPNRGNDAFPGITILGAGETPAGAPGNTITITTNSDKTPAPLQTSYGITLIASGASGGGLPDFGMFSNEQVHTVYLDMRRTIQDEPLTWTAEFGVKHLQATAENERVTNVGGQQEVLLPFPITKERPTMPADLVRKYPERLVIAYGVVSVEGKMEQLSIKQSPDPLLNEAVLSALRKWTFRPARRNGEVIPAKILLGIPVRVN